MAVHERDPQRVLVVDDEPNITDLVAMALRYEGFAVQTPPPAAPRWPPSGPRWSCWTSCCRNWNGLDVLRRLVAEGRRVPVIFLTARDATEDKVRGLTVGGDDYVTKPVSIEELVARVRAVLRRNGGDAASTGHLALADLELDEDAREVRRPGQPIELTPKEFRLLRYLLVDAGRVLTRNQIPRPRVGWCATRWCTRRRERRSRSRSPGRMGTPS